MDEYSRREWSRFAVEHRGIGTCVASATRDAAGDDQRLGFRKGELVTVLCCFTEPGETTRPDHWFLGSCGYSIGFFQRKDMDAIPKLRSVGTVDARLPPQERLLAPAAKLMGFLVPPDRVLVPLENEDNVQQLPSVNMNQAMDGGQDNKAAVKPATPELVPDALLFASASKSSADARSSDGDVFDEYSKEDYETLNSIYDAYFRPTTFIESDMQSTPTKNVLPTSPVSTSSLGDDSMTQPRQIDQVLDAMSDEMPNRLLGKDDQVQNSPSLSSMDSHGTKGSPARSATHPPVDLMQPLPMTPTRSRHTVTNNNGSPNRMPRGLSQQPTTSSPLLRSAVPMSPSQSSVRITPCVSSPSSLTSARPSTSSDAPLPRPAPNVYGSPRSKPALDLSEHALPGRAQLFQQWTTILTDRSTMTSKAHKKALQLVHVGVPNPLRGRVWLMLAERHVHPKPGVFERLCRSSMESQQHPDRYSFSTLIEQDLNQCFPLTQPFEGLNGSTRDTIRSILHAYAYYNPSVGYTEGMCLLVGLLLTHLHMEDAFWLLDGIVQGYGLDRIYSGDMRRLRVDNLVIDELVRLVDSSLHQRFRELHIEPIMFLPGWILPIFVRTLPWTTLLRVWDLFLCYGYVFLLRTTVAIICLSRDSIMHVPSGGDSRSAVIRNLVFVHPGPLTEEDVLTRALELPVTDKEIVRMESAAESLVGDASRPSTALDKGDSNLRGQLQGKPVTKKTMWLLLGRRN